MAYRRRQGLTRASTFKEEVRRQPDDSTSSPSMAAQAIRDSAAHRDASLSSAYGIFAFHSSFNSRPMKGQSVGDNKTAETVQEMHKKQQITRKESSSQDPWQHPSVQSTTTQMPATQESRLKAPRDVAMATAAKAKLLLRELKTVKADLAFAKERCAQLEEENKILREAREKGVNPADDDMIRRQLETLLGEKARLAHENSAYARENCILKEIVEHHQLSKHYVVHLDDDIEKEEVTEISPIPAVSRPLTVALPSPTSPCLHP